MFEGQGHAAVVSALLGDPAGGTANQTMVEVTGKALDAIWQVAVPILGVVTLVAVADRVVFNAVDPYPFLAGLTVTDAGVDLASMQQRFQTVPPADLKAACNSLLIDLLTVLGTLTAEILTPALHTALAQLGAATSREQAACDIKPQTDKEGGR